MMRSRIIAKLKSNKGETLLELLAACIIAVLAVSMVAEVMVSASRVMQRMDGIYSSTASVIEKFWNESSPSSTELISIEANTSDFEFDGVLNGYTVTDDDGKSVTLYEITKS